MSSWGPLADAEVQELLLAFEGWVKISPTPATEIAKKAAERFAADRDNLLRLLEKHPAPEPNNDWKEWGQKVIAWRKEARQVITAARGK